MKILQFVLATCCAMALGACNAAPATPAGLVKALHQALDKGDFDAARQLADLDQSPADLHFFYFEMVRECASESDCTVSEAPATDEVREKIKRQAESLGAAQLPPIDGMILVASKSRDGSSSGTMKMPYGKVGDSYKIVSIRYSAAELAAIRAKTSESLTTEMFAEGIYDPATRERRTDWSTAATRLPPDGGEVGKAFVKQTAAMAAAVDARDPDAAMRSGGQMTMIVFRDKDFDGKPIPRVDRQHKLHVQSLRMLRDVRVEGGYQLGDDAVLLIEARDGIGWIARGPILLSRDGEFWAKAGDNMISYPASP